MTPQIRLQADLAFSVDPSGGAGHPDAGLRGTIRADGRHLVVQTDGLAAMSTRASTQGVRRLADVLARQGLTLSVSGPRGPVVTLGAVRPGVVQRVLTRSRHLRVDSWPAALAGWRRARRGSPGPTLAELLPPPVLLPLAPTFARTRRRVTTTHDPLGGGRPRLAFSLGPAPRAGATRRVYYLAPGGTTVGSDPASDLRLDGVDPRTAEIRRTDDDEYYLVPVSRTVPVTVNGVVAERHLLRTGSRVRIGLWTMAYFREEYADHGRPYGGREGGEFSVQRSQRVPAYRTPRTRPRR